MTKIAGLPVHPAATLFPPMRGDEMQGLIADIKAHGQREKVVLLNGSILDGCNRALACDELGIEVLTVELSAADVGDPYAYAVSVNLHRRHLSDDQRALIGAKLATMQHGGTRRGSTSQNATLKTNAQVAERLQVSEAQIDRAKKFTKDAPDLAEAVIAGKMNGTAARKILKDRKPTPQAAPEAPPLKPRPASNNKKEEPTQPAPPPQKDEDMVKTPRTKGREEELRKIGAAHLDGEPASALIERYKLRTKHDVHNAALFEEGCRYMHDLLNGGPAWTELKQRRGSAVTEWQRLVQEAQVEALRYLNDMIDQAIGGERTRQLRADLAPLLGYVRHEKPLMTRKQYNDFLKVSYPIGEGREVASEETKRRCHDYLVTMEPVFVTEVLKEKVDELQSYLDGFKEKMEALKRTTEQRQRDAQARKAAP